MTAHPHIIPEQNQQLTIDPGIRDIDPKNPKLHMIQSRADMDFDTVTKYAQMMLDGIAFEPGKAFEDERGNIWGYDGKHRHEACIEATNSSQNTIHQKFLLRLDIRPGTQEDAEWEALGANKFHGLQRSDRDVDRIIREAFLSPKRPSEREISRHTGFSRRQVKNIRIEMQEEGLLDRNYKPIVTRNGREFEQDNTQRREKLSGPPVPDTQPIQIGMPGTEKYFSIAELERLMADYAVGSRKERVNYWQNIVRKTVVGQSYLREIGNAIRHEGRQQNKIFRKADLLYAVKNLRNALETVHCASCDFTGKDAQMFLQNGKWYCSQCFHTIQQRQPGPTVQGDASVLDNLIMRQVQHLSPEEQVANLKKAIFNTNESLDILSEMIPGFPKEAIRDRCKVLYKQLTAYSDFGNCAKCDKPLTGPGNFWYDGQHQHQAICDRCAASHNRQDVTGNDLDKVCDALRRDERLTPELVRRLIDDANLTQGERDIALAMMDYVDRHGMTVRSSAQPEPVRTVKDLCLDCEFHRGRNNPKRGKSLGKHYYGKCIREGGLCEDVVEIIKREERL